MPTPRPARFLLLAATTSLTLLSGCADSHRHVAHNSLGQRVDPGLSDPPGVAMSDEELKDRFGLPSHVWLSSESPDLAVRMYELVLPPDQKKSDAPLLMLFSLMFPPAIILALPCALIDFAVVSFENLERNLNRESVDYYLLVYSGIDGQLVSAAASRHYPVDKHSGSRASRGAGTHGLPRTVGDLYWFSTNRHFPVSLPSDLRKIPLAGYAADRVATGVDQSR